jgi:hypothetical protein
MIALLIVALLTFCVGMSIGWWVTNRRRTQEHAQAATRLESLYQSERAELLSQTNRNRTEQREELAAVSAASLVDQTNAVAAAVAKVQAEANEHTHLLLAQRREADELLRESSKRHAAESRHSKAIAAKQIAEFEIQVATLRSELDLMRTVVAMPATMDAMARQIPATGPAERPRAVDFSVLAARVRGTALIDAVTISDEHGMSLTGGTSADIDHSASVVPSLHKANRLVGAIVGQLHGATMLTSTMRMFEFRRLPSWTNDAWLVALARSQRPNAAALDAAVAYATLIRPRQESTRSPAPAGTNQRIGRGSIRADVISNELESQRAGVKASVFALLNGADIAAGVVHDGPNANQCDSLAATLHQLRRAARGALHELDLVRLELYTSSGLRLGIAPLSFNSKLSLMYITASRGLEDLEIERSIGHLRRLLSATGASAEVAA